MKFVASIVGFGLELFIKSITRPQNVYTKLAVASLLLFGGSFITPFWEKVAEVLLSSSTNCQCGNSIPFIAYGPIFLLLTILFALLSNRAATHDSEAIVNPVSISAPITIGLSSVHCYCGSVLAISKIDVLVTSENTDLHLGSIGGTSVSGRVRRLGASFNSDGTLASDYIKNDIDFWKAQQIHGGPYGLGICIPTEPHNAASRGIKKVIHAIALKKLDSGVNYVDEAAVRKIIDFSIEYSVDNNFDSMFLPVFGAGSGGLFGDEAVLKSMNSLVASIKESNCRLNIYVGTYRASDALRVASKLLKLK